MLYGLNAGLQLRDGHFSWHVANFLGGLLSAGYLTKDSLQLWGCMQFDISGPLSTNTSLSKFKAVQRMAVVYTPMCKTNFYRHKRLFLPTALASGAVNWEEGSLQLLTNSVLPRASIIQKTNKRKKNPLRKSRFKIRLTSSSCLMQDRITPVNLTGLYTEY